MEKLTLYIKESYNELINKVTWPSMSSLQSTTVVVLVASVILSLIIFLMDLFSRQFMGLIYSLS
jgi:preprotein translocase subunit SecE